MYGPRDPKIEGNSNLYIAEMENPWTIKSPQVMISKPDYDNLFGKRNRSQLLYGDVICERV
jgi:GH43 family beta-xylosidase